MTTQLIPEWRVGSVSKAFPYLKNNIKEKILMSNGWQKMHQKSNKTNATKTSIYNHIKD